MRQRFIISGVLIIVSFFWMYRAIFLYGIWNDESPGGGMLPLIASITTIIFSVGAILKPQLISKPLHSTIFIPIALVIFIIATVNIIGMLPALLLVLIFWFKFLERYSWKFTIIASACTIGMVKLIFSIWLKVPFPVGFFA